MTRTIWLIAVLALCVACAAPKPTVTPVPPSPATPTPLPALAGAYKPIQLNDVIEGAKIGYQYVLPSPDKPTVVVAFGEGMLELVSVKQSLQNSLVEYIRELSREPRQVYAFDEADPDQADPKLLTLEANRPVEIVIIPINGENRYWSVIETEQGDIRAAYKLVRRKDSGLRFIDAYSLEAMNSFTQLATLNGGGAGLVFSARLALLKLILSDEAYQHGLDVIANHPPQISQYDPRILKIDPAQPGILQNTDWVLVSQTGPNADRPAP